MTTEAPAPAGGSPEHGGADTVQVPSVGVYMTPRHAYYLNGDGPVPSVTTVLGMISKPAVAVFMAKEAARAMYRSDIEWASEELAMAWAVKQADNIRDTAGNLGSSVHLLAELEGSQKAVDGFRVSDDTIPYLDAYRSFLTLYGGSQSIVSSEHAVWSLQGYAGTYDLMMMLPCEECRIQRIQISEGDNCADMELWLIDIKTSGKGPYPEWGLQLAGYRWADYIVIENDPVLYPMPEIKHSGVLHLRPDLYTEGNGWRLIEYPISYDLDYRAFLSALDLWRWKDSKRFTKSKLLKP